MEIPVLNRQRSHKENLYLYNHSESDKQIGDRLKLTKRGKAVLASATVAAIALTAGIVGCDSNESDSNRTSSDTNAKYIDTYSDNLDYEVHLGENNVIIFEDGAKIRPDHSIDDVPNFQEVKTDGDKAMIKPELIIEYRGDENNGNWYGFTEDSINRDPVLGDFKDRMLFSDGLLWVNCEKATLEIDNLEES